MDKPLTKEYCLKKLMAAKEPAEYIKWDQLLRDAAEFERRGEEELKKMLKKNFGFRPGFDRLTIK